MARLLLGSMAAAALLAATLLTPLSGEARSASSPRHSGTEMPGGPRKLDNIPGAVSSSRNMDGTHGRLDAYGRPIMREAPPEKKPRKRLPAGAYGGYGKQEEVRPLPDVTPERPAWNF